MNQKPTQLFESQSGKARIYVDNDMAIGEFHDFLMELKGIMIEKMVAAQKDQEQQAEEAKS
jgi:hypothetical protein